jgi:competence protein ComEA
MQSARDEPAWRRYLAAAKSFVARRPWLMLFLGLLGLFTAIGSTSLSSASGTEVIKPSANPSASSPSAIQLPEIYVHVVGEVKTPGLYLLPTASRLVSLIALAGGFTPEADQASVNLARVLTDGEQVFVLSRSQTVSQGASGAMSGASTGSSGSKISLNRATQSELEALPRVGPALAARIIDWRTANGGFKTKEDLLKVAGFGDKMFAAVKDQVTL